VIRHLVRMDFCLSDCQHQPWNPQILPSKGTAVFSPRVSRLQNEPDSKHPSSAQVSSARRFVFICVSVFVSRCCTNTGTAVPVYPAFCGGRDIVGGTVQAQTGWTIEECYVLQNGGIGCGRLISLVKGTVNSCVNQSECGTDFSLPPSAEVKECMEVCPHFPCVFMACTGSPLL
jgi:hypothetical protein